MKSDILLSVVIVFILFACGQRRELSYFEANFKPELRKHIKAITSIGYIPYDMDSSTKEYLTDSCSKDDLLNLLNYENPLVRVTAYQAILNRKEPDYFSILLNHLEDTTKVLWFYYDDSGDEFAVSDIMVMNADNVGKLTRQQKDTLVGLVLTYYPFLEISNWMIQDVCPIEKYYHLIRERAGVKSKKCGVQMGANYALAKYKKREDIPYLKENLINGNKVCSRWIFKAIEVFPDTSFYSVLTNYFENVITKEEYHSYDYLKFYYRAIAQYRTNESLTILTALTKAETYPNEWYLPYYKRAVFQAIYKYKSPLYDSVFNSLKPEMPDFIIKSIDKPDWDDRTTW